MEAVARVEDLRISVAASGAEIVEGVSFTVGAGEIVGLVGESGSGKTTVALSLLGLARRGTRIAGGTVAVAGNEMSALGPRALRELRGKVVAYVPQDPAAALNPAIRIAGQLEEVLEAHGVEGDGAARRNRVRQALRDVRLPDAPDFLQRFPHQLSGGQQQRVCIAMAFLLGPKLIVMDEPTTGLDVSTQAHVLQIVSRLCGETGTAAVYVSHDLAVVGTLASRVLVMYAGRLVESGPARAIFERPVHPYTRKLIEASPEVTARRLLAAIPGTVPSPGERPSGCVFAPRCEHAIDVCTAASPPSVAVESQQVLCVRALELGDSGPRRGAAAHGEDACPEPGAAALLAVRDLQAFYGTTKVLGGVTLELAAGECLALVGQSGSGKSTLSRAIVGLHTSCTGAIELEGRALEADVRSRPVELCRQLQYIFQSPYNSLNPRRAVGDIVATPLRHFFGLRGAAARQRAGELLERVALSAGAQHRYPDELSGGERQRVAIARALAAEPKVLICDEITSALDASVQAAIVQLLERLQREEGLALLFVTHNVALVRTVAQRVLVLDGGRIVEQGAVSDVIERPKHAYTRMLIDDTPTLDAVPKQLA